MSGKRNVRGGFGAKEKYQSGNEHSAGSTDKGSALTSLSVFQTRSLQAFPGAAPDAAFFKAALLEAPNSVRAPIR